jgi:hypothetical protein
MIFSVFTYIKINFSIGRQLREFPVWFLLVPSRARLLTLVVKLFKRRVGSPKFETNLKFIVLKLLQVLHFLLTIMLSQHKGRISHMARKHSVHMNGVQFNI